jgi:ABC-type multidrug transport system ATPase subunit
MDKDENFSAALSWSNLTVTTVSKSRNPSRKILSNAHGTVRPGEFLAVMGPSGAGKTTLLNCLSQRPQKNTKIESGSILLNNIPISSVPYASMIGFVPQDDILFSSMTPREILTFAATLTLNASKSSVESHVSQIIDDLGLLACADTVVGGQLVRGLSGGEKKRTSVGIELISNPSVLFLDEPTTGLDSFIALSITQLIVSISKTYKRTVIATIHQPSSQIFDCFDRLLLLSQGMTVYMGKASKTIEFFSELGYPIPKNYNPGDHCLNVISENSFKMSEYPLNYSIFEDSNIINRQVYRPGFFLTLRLLVWRAYLDMVRNPMNLAAKIFKIIMYASMSSAVFWDLGKDRQGIYDRESLIFVMMCTYSIEAHLSVIQTFQMHKSVFLREYFQERYSVFVYFLSYNLINIPLELAWDVLFTLSLYYQLSLNTYPMSVVKYYIAAVMSGIIGSGFGMLLSIVCKSMESGAVWSMITLVPMWLCSGFLVNYDDIPKWFFLKWISPYYFTFQAGIIPQLDDLHGAEDLAHDAKKQLNLPNTYNECILFMILVIIFYRTVSFFLLKYLPRFQ